MIGQRLKELRRQTGRTQKEVASDLGLSRQALSHLENNRNEPDLKTVVQLSTYYNVSIDSLFGIEQVPSKLTNNGIVDLEKLLNNEDPLLFNGITLTTKEKQGIKEILTTIFSKLTN